MLIFFDYELRKHVEKIKTKRKKNIFTVYSSDSNIKITTKKLAKGPQKPFQKPYLCRNIIFLQTGERKSIQHLPYA